MEKPTDSGSDDETANTNDVNGQVNQSKRGNKQVMGINSSSEASGSQPSLTESNTQPKSRSRSPLTSEKPTWNSPNAFINYMHDFKQNQVEYPDKLSGPNLFRLAGEQWRRMSQEEKQPYIDSATSAKKQKALRSPKVTKRSSQLKTVIKSKKSDTASKNKKRETKSKSRSNRMKQQGIYLKVTDSENESDSEEKSSDIEF